MSDVTQTVPDSQNNLPRKFKDMGDNSFAEIVAAATADGSDVALGAKADVRASWYTSTASLIALIKLFIAVTVGAGTHTYAYTNGLLVTDTWILFGSTYVKTYTYVAGVMTTESDWVLQ